MRAVNAAAQAIRESGRAIKEVPLVWIRSVNRNTGAFEPIGIWAGAETETISVRGLFSGDVVDHVFNPGLLPSGVSEVTHEAGITIRPTAIDFSPLAPAVQIAFREHDARGARVEVWRRAYDVDTRRPVAGLPEPWFSGYVNDAPITVPAMGGESALRCEVVSTSRMLTIASPLRKSDAAQRRREGDRFRRYKATAPTWDVEWTGDA